MTPSLSPRARVARVVVLVVNWLSRVSGRGSGTVAGGRVGLAICPDLLDQLATSRLVILVSGTNGKTTTSAMTATGWGGDVTTNATGANMAAGHVAALVGSQHPRVVLEVDEAWLPDVIRATKPAVVVLLNLSRDQLDRASEVRQLAERWHGCLSDQQNNRLVVVANANDPLVVFAASAAPLVRWCDVPTPWLGDATSCPRCTRPLVHEANTWSCECGFSKPSTMTTTLDNGLEVAGVSVHLELSMPGAFNEANAAMAVTALNEVGISPNDAIARINTLSGVAGRFTFRRWGDHRFRLSLAKNPAGFAAILSTVDPEPGDVWIAINANIADGRDPSWLYDVPFESLRGHRVYCLGDRRLDLATRLEYANVDFRVVDDPSSLPVATEPVALVANYTAFSDWLAKSAPC